MFSRLKQSRDLPAPNVKRLQHLDQLVNDQIAPLPYEVHRVLAFGKVNG
jgi:hypothetical protein